MVGRENEDLECWRWWVGKIRICKVGESVIWEGWCGPVDVLIHSGVHIAPTVNIVLVFIWAHLWSSSALEAFGRKYCNASQLECNSKEHL